MRRRFFTFIAASGIAIVTGLAIFASPAAAAAAATTPPSNPSQFICGTNSGSINTGSNSANNYLPINRWGSAAGGDLHTDLAGGILGSVGSLPNTIQRNFVISSMMSVGNALWAVGADLTQMASQFCFANEAGFQADQIASGLGNAITQSGVIALLLVIMLIGVIWKASRGTERPTAKIVRSIIILVIFSVMVAGASSTINAGPFGGGTVYGTLSPGWLTTKLFGAVSNVASYPVAAISTSAQSIATATPSNTPTTGFNCAAYSHELIKQYMASYGPGAMTSSQATVPIAVNDMWMNSGLQSYIDAQFGASNNYGQNVYCHLLDQSTGVKSQSQSGIVQLAGGAPPPPSGASLAFPPPGAPNQTVDASMIGWAACNYSGGAWSVNPEWSGVQNPGQSPGLISTGISLGTFGAVGGGNTGGGPITNQDCNQWWTSSAIPGPMNWGSSANNIVSATSSSPQVANFLLNFHGDQNGAATITAIGFAIASVVVFGVFVILAGAVILAKFALLILMAIFVIFLLVDLFPSNGPSKAVGYAKHALSYMILATGAQIVLTMVAIFTGLIANLGTSVSGQGSLLSIIWLSFAPVAAVLVIHHLFKALKAPSPFKMTSALAWGAAASGVGVGLGAGIDNMLNRGKQRVKGAAADQTVGRGKRAFGAARNERPVGSMKPKDDPNAPKQTLVDGTKPGPKDGQDGVDNATETPSSTQAPEKVPSMAQRRTDALKRERAGRNALRAEQGGVAKRVSDRAALAMERFRARPIRKSLGIAAAGLGAMAFPFGAVPALGIIAAGYAAHKAKQAKAERPALRAERRREYEEAMLRSEAEARQSQDRGSALGAPEQPLGGRNDGTAEPTT